MNPDVQSVPNVSGMDLYKLYQFACEQAIAGVLFEGVKRLGEHGIKPTFDVLMQWIATAERIEGQNRLLNKRCVEIVREYQKAGFQCCVLKGQGNALIYPNPYSRTSGDIDVIIKNANRESLMQYVRDKKGTTECHFQHVEYDEDGVSVELHFIPCYMNNPIYHRRLQKWFTIQAEKDDIWNNLVELPESIGSITIPSVQYNLIHQLAHMMHHFFDEGIGLRQMIDYYYVLKRIEDPLRLPLYKGRNLEETLKYLGLWKFAGAVMYIMKEVLGLEDKYLILPVDERRGKTLLQEILKGGNFGHYSGLEQHNAAKKYFQKTWRNMKLVKEYPAEALCEPVFRTWHFFWRLSHR